MLLKLDKLAAEILQSYGDLESEEFFRDPEEAAPEELELWLAAQDCDGEPCEVELSADAATQLDGELENELHADPWCENDAMVRKLATYKRNIQKSRDKLRAQGVKPFVHVCDR